MLVTLQNRSKDMTDQIADLTARVTAAEEDASTARQLASARLKEVESVTARRELEQARHDTALRQIESKLRVELELMVSH